MEQSTNQSPYIRISLIIARFVGIYMLGIAIFLGLVRVQVISTSAFYSFQTVLVTLFFATPLIWSLSGDFKTGFSRYATVLGLIIIFSKSNASSSSKNSSGTSEETISYIGNYSGEDNGVGIKVMIGTDSWYGEVFEGTSGGLISTESGNFVDGKLYDSYENEIGSLQGSTLRITIQGQRVRLTKD